MSQSTSPIDFVSENVMLKPLLLDNRDPLFPILSVLLSSSLLTVIEILVVPGIHALDAADIIELADGSFAGPDEFKFQTLMAFLVLRDSIYYGFNNVLTEDVRSPRLTDEMMLEVLQFTAKGSVLAETLYHCISYIPGFYRATWATRAEALAHERRIQLYLRRLITILGALLKVSLEDGIADRWNFGACDGWSCYDFLEAVSPGFIQLEAERRGLSLSALRQTYGWHYDEDGPLFFWDYERWESNVSEDGGAIDYTAYTVFGRYRQKVNLPILYRLL
ncbi:hypothetical protein BDZ89DRAFT_1133820 [Hymenopellis radicata]|nr:hypothetical protein BDZ89DRAFT_1133820 [Hymenopellis radicata]